MGNKLCLISFLLLMVNFGFAQNDTLQLLKGEWYYFGLTKPDVNDSFRLSRDKIHDSYLKWEFMENGSFYKQDVTELGDSGEHSLILYANISSIWIYNKKRQTIELRDLSEMYRITGINENFLELLRLK